MSKGTIAAAEGLEGLEPFVGKWHTEGQQFDGPLGPAAPFVAVETFEWLEGGHFLVHEVDGRFGERPAACIEIIGRMGPRKELTARTFYNDGHTNTWRLDQQQGTWVFSGDWPNSPGTPFKVRLTITFEDAGNTLVGKWDVSSDGQDWKPFLDARSTKAQALPNASVGG